MKAPTGNTSRLLKSWCAVHWVLVAAALVTGCGGESKEQQIALARASIERKDLNSAVIRLKTVLQTDPASGEARYLLGDTLLKLGDYSGAMVELGRAADLKHDDNAVTPSLVKAMVATGQANKAIELYAATTLSQPLAAAQLKLALASAYAVQGKDGAMDAAIQAALLSDPKNVEARLHQARAFAKRRDFDAALKLANVLVAEQAKSREAWQLLGELLWSGKSDSDGAVKALRQALEVDARYMPAHAALLAIHLQRSDAKAFKAQFLELKRALPEHAETRFYEAQLAFAEKDYKRARELSQQLLRTGPDNPRLLQLGGAIEAAGGSTALAQTHLTNALQLAPDLSFARLLLAETYIRTGQPDRALSTLKPMLDREKPPAEALALAAEAHLQANEPGKAEVLFRRAAKANPSDIKAQAALALAQIGKGDAGAGFAALESAATNDTTMYADLALIGARMRRNELDAALQAVDRLQAKAPKKASPYHLRGRILVARKDYVGARASFEKALAVDPDFFPAVTSLAAVDIAENKSEQASKRFEEALARNPKNLRALVALVELRLRSGTGAADIERMLTDAIRQNPGEPAPRVLLVEQHLLRGNAKAAVVVAQEAVVALRDEPRSLAMLGKAQLANGDALQAVAALGKLVALQPNTAEPLMMLADAQAAANYKDATVRTLRSVLGITPNNIEAQRRLMQYALADQRFDQALEIARSVQKQHPKQAAGFLFESEVQAKQKRWGQALSMAEAALERHRASETASKIYSLHIVAGRTAEAQRFANEWLREQPGDVAFLGNLGAMAIEGRDYAGAEKRFRAVIALRPDDASALNNLAWLLVQQNKPGAVALAQRANQLAPNRPAVMDTLAAAFAAENDFSKALEWQRKASEAAPDAPALRLNLAKLLLKTDDRAAARTELQKLAKLGDKFAGQSEVRALLKSISSGSSKS